MIKKIDHLGIAILDPARGLAVFSEALGLRLEQIEDIPSQKLRSYHLRAGESHLELLFPTDPESTVAKFIEKKGAGFHHLALEVDDIEEERDRLAAAGLEPLSQEPFIGAGGKMVLFFHPRTTGGVLLEICQSKDAGIGHARAGHAGVGGAGIGDAGVNDPCIAEPNVESLGDGIPQAQDPGREGPGHGGAGHA